MKTIIAILTIIIFSQCTVMPFIDSDIIIPQPQVFECDQLIHLNDTAFTVVTVVWFNGKPDNVKWKYKSDGDNNQIVADSLHHLIDLVYPGNNWTYTTYENDIATSVFVDGTNNAQLFTQYFWARDEIGQKAATTGFSQAMYTYGSMTFDESLYEGKKRKNILSFHFTYTDYTPEQYSILGRTYMHFDECKHGENRANFWGATGIKQSVIDSSDLYLWPVINQLDTEHIIKS